MMTIKVATAHSIVYTFVFLLVGMLWIQGYIFVPTVPWFYAALIVPCVIQSICFRKFCENSTICKLYYLNLLANILLLCRVEVLIGTQYFQIFHFMVVLSCITKYWRNLRGRALFALSLPVSLVSVFATATKLAISFGKMLIAAILSIMISLLLIIDMHPKIQISGDDIRFGYPYDDPFVDTDAIPIRSKDLDISLTW